MIPLPNVQPSALVPIGLVAVGAMLVLMGEVFLSRAKTFFGREVTESFIGTVLAVTAIVFLALALYITGMTFASGEMLVFNLDHSMYQLDRFSSLMTARNMWRTAAPLLAVKAQNSGE